MKTPKTRVEFESHINLLVNDSKRIIESTYDIRLVRAFKRAKFLPNGRCNFVTIDTQVRLRANMEATMRQMREADFLLSKNNTDE